MADSQYHRFLEQNHTNDPAYGRAVEPNGPRGPSNRWSRLAVHGPENAA